MQVTLDWFLLVTGLLTAIGGLSAALFPAVVLRLGFELPSGPIVFFVRHWGLLIALVGALTVWSVYVPAGREAVLTAAIVEKFAIGLLVFFGPIKRTTVMTTVALADAFFAVVYLTSLTLSSRA